MRRLALIKEVGIDPGAAAVVGLEGTIMGSRLPSEPCSSWVARLTGLLLGQQCDLSDLLSSCARR